LAKWHIKLWFFNTFSWLLDMKEYLVLVL
jgi:hypothetical protein